MKPSISTLPLIDLRPPHSTLRDEVLAGLLAPKKSLPCKLFYDAAGTALFEQIALLPEYYPTRTEMEILRVDAPSIARRIGPRALIVGFGTGSGRKTRLLLSALKDPAGYVAIDVAPRAVLQSARTLSAQFPELLVQPVCADFTYPFDLDLSPFGPHDVRRVGFFPGSTIGNLSSDQARAFLDRVAALVGPGGALLVGIDLVKNRSVLESAYNDAAGITAEFNKNALVHVNHAFAADFNPECFEHIAYFNEPRSCIEMHLASLVLNVVHVDSHEIEIRAGESIHTEDSFKWTLPAFEAFAAGSKFAVDGCWTDSREWFAVVLLRC